MKAQALARSTLAFLTKRVPSGLNISPAECSRISGARHEQTCRDTVTCERFSNSRLFWQLRWSSTVKGIMVLLLYSKRNTPTHAAGVTDDRTSAESFASNLLHLWEPTHYTILCANVPTSYKQRHLLHQPMTAMKEVSRPFYFCRKPYDQQCSLSLPTLHRG